MSNDLAYIVHAYDPEKIIIRKQYTAATLTGVTIPRASVASVRRHMGKWTIETSGGRRYTVYPGFSRAQGKLTEAAFTDTTGSGSRSNAKERAAEEKAKRKEMKAAAKLADKTGDWSGLTTAQRSAREARQERQAGWGVQQ